VLGSSARSLASRSIRAALLSSKRDEERRTAALTTPLFCCRMPERRFHWEAFATSKSWHDSTVPLPSCAVVQLCRSGTVESDDRIWSPLTHSTVQLSQLFRCIHAQGAALSKCAVTALSRRSHWHAAVMPYGGRGHASVTAQCAQCAPHGARQQEPAPAGPRAALVLTAPAPAPDMLLPAPMP
jgi:hypothetical protein